MEKSYFVISDVHGEYQLLDELLSYWNPEQQQLVFLGDLIDRGPNSKKSVLKAMQLVQEKDAWYIMGNHEMMFLTWLDNPVERWDHYYRNEGSTTINQLLHRPVEVIVDPLKDSLKIKEIYPELIVFLKERPLYIDQGDVLFVHAGVDLRLPHWKETLPKDYFWIREPFHLGENHTGKTIIFGHTPLQSLNEDGSFMRLWQQDHKIGMDGGAVFGGALHGIVWQNGRILNQYSVLHDRNK